VPFFQLSVVELELELVSEARVSNVVMVDCVNETIHMRTCMFNVVMLLLVIVVIDVQCVQKLVV
jgi:hypothetical protein